MDKFIKVDNFKLLCDPRKLKHKKHKTNKTNKPNGKLTLKFIDKSYLNSFKKFIINKINTFIPNQSKDNFDILIMSIWHQFIFNNVDNLKYYDFVKILNNKVEHYNLAKNDDKMDDSLSKNDDKIYDNLDKNDDKIDDNLDKNDSK